MNKKTLIATAVILCVAGLILFLEFSLMGGDTSDTKRVIGSSEGYSEQEIVDAMDLVEDTFHRGWSGCTLTDLWYEEDEETNDANANWASQYHMEDAIVLLSNFDVDASGGPSHAMNPNTTYSNWQWVLVRDQDSDKWRVMTNGY